MSENDLKKPKKLQARARFETRDDFDENFLKFLEISSKFNFFIKIHFLI